MTKRYKKTLCWLRRDLRLEDHCALSVATENSQEVFLVFVFDTTILGKIKNDKDRRLTFIYKSLLELKENLESKGSSLILLYGNPTDEIPNLAKKIGVDAVFTNEDYEPSAIERDLKVKEKLKSNSIDFFSAKDQVIFSPRQVMKEDRTPYRVFTPYKKAWLASLKKQDHEELKIHFKALAPGNEVKKFSQKLTLKDIGFEEVDLWLKPGQKAAQERFKNFQKYIDNYNKNRDYPSLDNGTSGLSVHLRFGTISIRQLVRFCVHKRSQGAEIWLSELIWREFYFMILGNFPYVVKESFNPKYKNLEWQGEEKDFKAWKEGRTGFPLVDAAMRHFNETGWMHNRLRMVVASFLTKDLLIDWKKGEKYFADYLLDFDLAANNGGWQWSASTGCDAQPYFRIFNPYSQSKKFDADGEFIKSQIPELKNFPTKYIHEPHLATPMEQEIAGCRIGRDYPEPIVDHSEQRDKALKMYKEI